MATYAVIENGAVINVIVADSKEIAEQVTEKECLEYTNENPLIIGATWSNEYSKYINPSPYASHIYDGENWVPPSPMPVEEGKYFEWNESTLSWDSFNIPLPPTEPEGTTIEE